MRHLLAFAALLLALIGPAEAQQRSSRGAAPPDPYLMFEAGKVWAGETSTLGLTPRTQTYSVGNRNLALIVAGQSNCGNVSPTTYVPASAAIDQFDIYNGGSYNFGTNGGLLGATTIIDSGSGLGNVAARLAQLFITNNIFDHVVLVPICIGSTTAAGWAGTSSATYVDQVAAGRLVLALNRLAARGITPSTTSWTFAISWWQGEQDNINGTSSASYQASMATIKSNVQAAGFSCATCRFFVNVETWYAGTTSSTIQGAQAAVVTSYPTFFFTGGNIDTLNATNRLSPANTHLNDTGSAAAALLVYNAIVASGAPY